MKILLIDDDDDTVFLMGVLFKKSDLVTEYFIKTRPTAALEFIKEKNTLPDCILVDLKMPEMSGFEFIEHLEAILGDKTPHVYVLSSSACHEDHVKATSYQSVKEFILKPFTKHKLEEIHRRLVV